MTNERDKAEILDSDCLKAFDHLYAYLNGELKDPETVAMMEHHLQHCRSCLSRAQFEREINQRLEKSDKPTLPASLKDRMKKLIDDF
ncbi:MAG: zf-HC2 domain-containing protein [Betaproteobacteria bacterium]|nr:MAG: zf-HC2 domain-containing protein [Betaproteobacteria bacterium]